MKTHSSLGKTFQRISAAVLASCLFMFGSATSHASTAYGTLNNFDCVNDTGVEAHGFEIELDDVHSRDITYTYDYNHYGIPKITEDNSDPLHPKVFIRYAGTRNPDGTWTAYTAIPSGPITPTDGHQFTNPAVNFGGEHFGAGYYGAPTAVKYNWLIDDGTGNLVHGPPVMVSTPTFTYYPPVVGQPVPQVQAAIVPPPPPAPPVLQFGVATWVKDIKTTTHNANKVKLVELVDPDPENPAAKDWRNGEPDEVETEWRILQTEFADAGNPKGELKGAAEDLPGGDETITRRYEFYKYIGPIDAESGEAMADEVGPDGIHGVGTVTYNDHIDPATGEWVEVTVDLSTVEVVGDFFGAQMAGFDLDQALGLIDHIPDGELNVAYAERTVVVGGGAAFFATTSGSLPDGTTLDGTTGIFSGTPTVAGVFTFTVEASDLSGVLVSKEYTVTIPAGAPVTSTITTSASPLVGGTTAGGGVFDNGTQVTVIATHNPGYGFVNWTEGGVEVSATAVYPFTVNADRTLVANFIPTYTVATSASPGAGGTTSGDGTFNSGTSVTVFATVNAGYSFVNWTEGGVQVSASASYNFTIGANRTLVANFVPVYTIATSASPANGGGTTGDGPYDAGSNVLVTATPNAGFAFVNWTENGGEVSTSSSYNFTIDANRTLVANFIAIAYNIATSASPGAGGSTSGGGTFSSGSSVTVLAAANAGYSFVNWTEGGSEVSTSASYSFTANANRTLVANFIPITYTIATSASPSAGGTTGGGGTVNSGSSVTVLATANAGYSFVNWTEGGSPVSASASYSFTANANRTLVANFTVAVASDFAGYYTGLATPTVASTNPARHVGLAGVSVVSTGAFTGKLTLGGSTYPVAFAGTFGNGGPAKFGSGGASTFEIKRKGLPSLFLVLNLDVQVPLTHQITGTLTENGPVVSALVLNRRLYTEAKNPVPPLVNVPASILDPATDGGAYTGVFHALTPADQGLPDTAFPQGHGWSLVTVKSTGAVSIAGLLADGQPFAYTNYLSKDNVLPLYLTPYGGTGTVSGSVNFRDMPAQSDADGAGLHWFKPARAYDYAYRAGWPNGIKTDFLGSKFVSPALTHKTVLGNDPATLPNANALLALSDGGLAGLLSDLLSINTQSKVTVLGPPPGGTGAKSIGVVLRGNGLLVGSFAQPACRIPSPFTGVVLQKTQKAGGHFLGASPAGSSGGPWQSGAVTITAQ